MSHRPGALNIEESFRRLEGRILVVCDFDGTLAPIVDHPADARPNPRGLSALVSLAANPRVDAVIMSGRGRDDLEGLVGEAPGIALIGEHGNDTSAGEPPVESELIEELTQRLEVISSDYPGTAVERKRLSVVFHFRRAEPDVVGEALSRVLEGPARLLGVVLSEGKKVLELHATDFGKGDAVKALRESTGSDQVVFLGDDATDETVFATLRPQDVGIKVGGGATKAGLRVDDVEAVADVLEALVDLIP